MERWMNLYDAGVVYIGPQNDAIFEGSGFLGNMIKPWKSIVGRQSFSFVLGVPANASCQFFQGVSRPPIDSKDVWQW